MPDAPPSLALVLQWLCLWCLPVFAIAAIAAWLLNLPALRIERARLFLDVLRLAIRSIPSPEQAIIALSATRDESLGARFHLLAAWLRSGLRFPEALRRLPSLVPAPLAAMLVAGHQAGSLPAAILAARRAAAPPHAQTRAALSCQIVMLFILNPLILASLPFFMMKLFPVLNGMAAGFGQSPPAAMLFLSNHSGAIFACQLASILFLYLGAAFYVGGNRFTRWIESGLFPLSAWIALRVPWKRKRLQRDFSAMFALLLDAGLPERKALELAGSSSANEIFEARVQLALAALQLGQSLPTALELLDPPREFAWRLANGLRRQGAATASFQGWFDALDAEADAQEQMAGDLISTFLVVLNGMIIALIIGAVMQFIYATSLLPVS